MSEKEDFKLKIIVIGQPAVGKTSLVRKFVSGEFNKDYRSTIGTNIYIKDVVLEDGRKVILNIWDIAGQERWIRMRNRYYNGTQGAVIVGDLSRKRTFENIEKFWYPDLKVHNLLIPIILIGNKHDLEAEISNQEVEDLKRRIKAELFITTSAKTGENVNEIFQKLSKKILDAINNK